MASLRPRERARLAGVDALRDEELLALLIGSGSRGEQAVDAGRRVLEEFGGDLHALGRSGLLRLEVFEALVPPGQSALPQRWNWVGEGWPVRIHPPRM